MYVHTLRSPILNNENQGEKMLDKYKGYETIIRLTMSEMKRGNITVMKFCFCLSLYFILFYFFENFDNDR